LSRLSTLSPAEVAACLSLGADDIRTGAHAPQVVGVGTPFVVAEVHSREAVRRARPDAVAFGRTLPRDGAFGIYFYSRELAAAEAPCELQARMFFPGASGLIEDPATGSATVAAAALLADLDPVRDSELKLTIGQGFDMGRPSMLLTRVRKEGGEILSAHVGGACVQMMQGTFSLAGEG
jgi:trans-2,3-dihydro-3-hydroxyanthranilate isomerase